MSDLLTKGSQHLLLTKKQYVFHLSWEKGMPLQKMLTKQIAKARNQVERFNEHLKKK